MKARNAMAWAIFLLVAAAGAAQLPDQSLPTGSAAEIAAFLSTNPYQPVPGDIYNLSIFSLLPLPGIASSSSQGGRLEYQAVMDREMRLNVPLTGMLDARGMDFEALRKAVISTVSAKLPADYIELGLAVPARFQIFVSGRVKKPGALTVTSLHKVSDALALAGGTDKGATLRKVGLSRSDGSVLSLDILSYFQTGKLSHNPLLRPGDRVTLGFAEKVVRVEGAVVSPGSYELLEGEGLERLLELASGLGPDALPERSRIIRRSVDGGYQTLSVDPLSGGGFALESGDILRVPSSTENPQVVTVEGAFYGKPLDAAGAISYPTALVEMPVKSTEGSVLRSLSLPVSVKLVMPWHPGMNLYDVMEKLGGPTPFAQSDGARVFGAKGSNERPFDPLALWEDPETARAILLEPGDYVYAPMKNQVVTVGGEVNLPRALPYLANRTAGEYLALAGGVSPYGSPSRLCLYDGLGRKVKRIGLEYRVQPEDILVVEPSGWKAFNEFWTRPGPISAILQVLGFVNTTVGVTANTWTLYDLITE